MTTPHYDVLVVGAGPAGLSTALSATRHGARVLVVERHAGTSVHPRAVGVTTRSMEVFRAWGLERAVRAASLDRSTMQTSMWTLADRVHTPSPAGYPTPEEARAVSPVEPALVPQDRLEPLLVRRLRELGGTVAFGTGLTGLRTDRHGVLAELTGPVAEVRSRFVVGADGPRSSVRRALGIATEHLGHRGDYASVLFRADLDPFVDDRRHFLYNIEHPDAAGVLLPAGDGRWVYGRRRTVGAGALTTVEDWTELLRTATGVPDLRTEILSVLPFSMEAEVATRFRRGPGFLVGDAAHRMTPMGGVGMNTAIHDGHNLGWKLAWFVRGYAGETLLHSYDAERRPVGTRNALSSLHPGAVHSPGGLLGDLGTTYRSDVIKPDGSEPPPSFAPAGRPGERAPHLWVELHGRRVSTLDLFDGHLTVLTGAPGRRWRIAVGADRRSGVPTTVLSVGGDLPDPDGRVARAFGLTPTGAVLVRPDGHVAARWAEPPADPVAALAPAVGSAFGRTYVLAGRVKPTAPSGTPRQVGR
jgi:2-polyprenyl-6-methoxyphenol hydroxylase-like FAD-dependent oxidoreductase